MTITGMASRLAMSTTPPRHTEVPDITGRVPGRDSVIAMGLQ